MGLLYRLTLYSNLCVCVWEGQWGFGSNGFVTSITIPKWLVIIGQTSLAVWALEVGLGHVASVM
jgi:hypothetical protein